MLTLEYAGDEKIDLFNFGANFLDLKKPIITLIHPVIRVYESNKLVDIIHCHEDLFANLVSKKIYIDKLKQTLSMYIDPTFT